MLVCQRLPRANIQKTHDNRFPYENDLPIVDFSHRTVGLLEGTNPLLVEDRMMVTPLLWVLVFKSATVNPRWNKILKRNSRQIIHNWEMFQPTMLNYHRIIESERFGKGWQSTCRIQAAILSWKLGDLVVTIPWWACTVAPFRTVPKSTQLSLARLPIYGWRHHILLVFHVSLFMISPCQLNLHWQA